MPAVRPPGVHNQIERPIGNDSGTLCRGTSPAAGPHGKGGTGLDSLTPEQRILVLDVTQLTLDVVGIFEPTPFADSANVIISMGRGDWIGAGISAVGVVPYIGDLAKAGKLSRYAGSVKKIVRAAQDDARFAQCILPTLHNLYFLLNKVDALALPKRLKTLIVESKHELQGILTKMAGRKPALRTNTAGKASHILLEWEERIAKLALNPPKDKGALWSKLGKDDLAQVRAGLLAVKDNRVTLEMLLKQTDFFTHYNAQFKGIQNRITAQIWEMVSRKYASKLEGTVVAYVNDVELAKSIKAGVLPQLTAELDEIVSIMEGNHNITSVIVKDLLNGTSGVLRREQVMGTMKLTH